MIVELESGKEVRFLNSKNGLERAAFDYTSGTKRTAAMRVYVTTAEGFGWMCSDKNLTESDITEAEELLQEKREEETEYAENNREAINRFSEVLEGKRFNESQAREFINKHASEYGVEPERMKRIWCIGSKRFDHHGNLLSTREQNVRVVRDALSQ